MITMIIFMDEGKVRLQLKNLTTNKMLFDFTVEPEFYEEMKDHIIEHLVKFKP